MSDQPTFSVIVPTYDRPDLVVEAVGSVVAQTVTDWECLVIDDAGTLPPPTFADERVVVHRRGENGGAAAAVNTGVELARGRYLTFLDDDDLWTPARLEIGLQGLARHPVAACASRYLDEEGPGTVRHLDGDVSAQILDAMGPPRGAVALERSSWLPLREDYRTCEDVEWLLRLAQESTMASDDALGLLVRRHAGARHLGGIEARRRDNDRLLADHATWFDGHPHARAFRLRRRAHYASLLGRRGEAVRALLASMRFHPSARTIKQLLLAVAGRPRPPGSAS